MATPQSPSDHDDVTARILDAARAEFHLVGIRRASMTDVVRRSGLGRTTLYRRFPDKDSLVAAVAALEIAEGYDAMNKEMEGVQGAEATIVALVVTVFRALREHTLLQRLLETEREEFLHYATGDGGAYAIAFGTAFVSGHVARLQAAGELPEGDPAIPAELLVRIITSLLLTPSATIPFQDDDRIAAFTRQHLLPLFTPAL